MVMRLKFMIYVVLFVLLLQFYLYLEYKQKNPINMQFY